MLSVIICSRTQTISEDLSENIKITIGCVYELIVIDNSESKYSIFEAYNLGIEKSKGDYCCLMHDDILIHTIGWGNIVQDVFKNDPEIGLIGVAGSKIKTKMPSAWWGCQSNQIVVNIIQHGQNKDIEKANFGFKNDDNVEVVFIDGVFMAMRKDERIQFNKLMIGFHNYDLNISFEYKKNGYKIFVTNKILIEHFSSGIINEEWVNSAYKIHALYKNNLPLKTIESSITKNIEVTNAKDFINECLKFKTYGIAYSVWWKLFCLYPYSKYHLKFHVIFLNKLLKNKKHIA